jgi:glycerol-3-phosphate acyltransferase PlsY
VIIDICLIAGAYLAGSLASAVIVARAMGLQDPRSAGSRNPGATNMLRLNGRPAAALTLAGDLLKGLLPVLLAGMAGSGPWVTALTGSAAFIGHLYPIFFGFQGGRGVATLIGVLLGSLWPLGLAYVGTWLVVAAAFRYSSLAAITAAALTPLYTWLLDGHLAYLVCYSVLAALLLWRHAPNIRNLLAGKESKI